MVMARSPYHCLHSLESTGQQALMTFLKRCLAHPVTRVGPSAGGMELTLPQEGGNHLCSLRILKKTALPVSFMKTKTYPPLCLQARERPKFRLPSHKILIKSCGRAFTFVTFLDRKTSKRRLKSLYDQCIGRVSVSQLSRAFWAATN